MSYERKIWVNNQTKLNATNMNHIEEGIESVSADSASALELAQSVSAKIDSLSVSVTDIAQKTADAGNLAADAKSLADGAVSQIKDVSAVAGEAKAVAEEAKAVADEAAEKIGEKQDILVSGTNIKSLNGESILGAGDIKVATNMPFSQLAKADLNALSEQGVYKIETAANYPIGTSPSGTLHVNKLGDAHYEQLWYSDSNWARRINEGTSPSPVKTYVLKVNGADYISSASNPLSISLDAAKSYDVSGDLIGHIEIGTAAEPAGPTKLRLKGVNILSDADSGIAYLPEKKKLTVEVFANTSNYIRVENGAEKDDAAAIISNSDLTITGAGFLSLYANLGHGLKASELTVNGLPKLKIDAAHDAFHASKLLRITGGDITIDNCNDAFSAGSADSPSKITVEMTITDGNFVINRVNDSLFQNKSTAGNCRIIKGNFTVSSDNVKGLFQEEAGGSKIVVYDLCSWTGLSTEQLAEVNERTLILADQYSECKVWYTDGASGETIYITDLGGQYALNGGEEVTYSVIGNITGKQFVTTDKKVNINLKGVYCDETDESGTILFDYQNVKSRLQINVTEGYINYIKKNSGIIFHSNSNLALKLKESDATETVPQKISIGYFSAPNGTAINAYCESTSEPSRSAIAGDGICYVTDSKVGVYANNLWLGNEYGDNGEADWGKAYISLYLKDNQTDAHIIWKETDEPKKSGYIYAPWYLLGTCVIGANLEFADSTKRWFAAPSGTIDSLYDNTPIVYTAADVSDYEINDNVTTYYFNFDILDRVIFEGTIADSSAEYGIWTVYNSPDNIYTKEEVDAKVAAAKEETRAEIAPLKPKTVAFTKDENISDITIYNYCSDSAIASPEAYAEPVYARDGDFGFPCIDGTGQVNFSPIFLSDYNALAISGDTANFKNFKTPYSTCKDKIYRLTKVIGDSIINLSAIDENTLDSYAITYRLVIPADYAGALPVITEYRTNDAMIANYLPKTLEFIDNACISKSYSKETGYPDKTESDAAQINFTAEWEEVEGYSMTVTTSAKNYKNFNIDGSKYQATKIKGDFEVIVTIASTKAMYGVTYVPSAYSFSTDAIEVPAQIAEKTALTFAFYHQTNQANPTKDTTCVPDGTDCGGSGTLPTAEACLNRISSVTIAGNPYEITSDMIVVSGKKATVTIPAAAILGDVAVTLA